MFAALHHIALAAVSPLITGARFVRNRMFPVDGIDLLMRLELSGHEGIDRRDLADLGPEGIVTALRWLSAMNAEGLVATILEDRYYLTARGHEAVRRLSQRPRAFDHAALLAA